MSDQTPVLGPPLRARLASGYLRVLKRYAGRDPEGVREVHAYVDYLRGELRTAQAILDAELGSAPDPAPETPAALQPGWAERVAAALAEQRTRPSPPARDPLAPLNPGTGQ